MNPHDDIVKEWALAVGNDPGARWLGRQIVAAVTQDWVLRLFDPSSVFVWLLISLVIYAPIYWALTRPREPDRETTDG
jgi:hypothetical protein